MIGDYKGYVKNRVVTALLQAYLDTLDYDGMKSILREAGLLELKDQRDINPDHRIDFFSFKKIIAAQNCLLFESKDLLFEIGRKFSFYLFPFGKSFQESVQEISELIDTNWNVRIIEQSDTQIKIQVINCIFCSELGIPCDLFKGFLVHTLEKTLASGETVHYETPPENTQNPNHNTFIIALNIEKRIK